MTRCSADKHQAGHPRQRGVRGNSPTIPRARGGNPSGRPRHGRWLK